MALPIPTEARTRSKVAVRRKSPPRHSRKLLAARPLTGPGDPTAGQRTTPPAGAGVDLSDAPQSVLGDDPWIELLDQSRALRLGCGQGSAERHAPIPRHPVCRPTRKPALDDFYEPRAVRRSGFFFVAALKEKPR
jgi:hypothetical protein